MSKGPGSKGQGPRYQDLEVKSPGEVKEVGSKGWGPRVTRFEGEITRWGQRGGRAKGVGSQGAGKDAGTGVGWDGQAGKEKTEPSPKGEEKTQVFDNNLGPKNVLKHMLIPA